MEWLAIAVLAVIIWSNARTAKRRTQALDSEVRALRRLLEGARPAEAPAAVAMPDAPAAAPRMSVAPPAPEAPPPQDMPEAPLPQAAPAPATPPPVAAPVSRPRLEEQLTSRWLVWLGGVTLALGGSFLAKYSIDQGWLGPTIRIVLGLLAGGAMIATSEALMQQRRAVFAAVQASYVPPALAAAGAVTIYATLFAAFRLLDLIPALGAFGGLAAASALTVLLGLRHGPYMAVLGLVGAFAVPAIVVTDRPSTIGLLLYLAVVAAGALAIGRARHWWWLGWVALAGCLGWLFARLVPPFDAIDSVAVALFAALLIALMVGFRNGIRPVSWLAPHSAPVAAVTPQVQLAAGALLVVLWLLVLRTAYDTVPIAALLGMGGLVLALGRRDAAFDLVPLGAAASALLLLLVWSLAFAHLADIGAPPPGAPARFAVTAVAAGALYGIGGFVALWGAPRAGRFAALSAATPLGVLAVAYYKFTVFDTDFAWTASGVGLAALALLAAQRLAAWRDDPALRAALAAYAAAVVAALALAATMALRDAWLTVVLSLLLPGLGWIHDRLRVPELRWIALAAAAVVLVRLVGNVYVVDYPARGSLGLSWVIYGYGVPALAFALATRLFRRERDDVVTQVLEAGAIAFTVLLVTVLIRQLLNDGVIDAGRYDLLERALQTLTWLGFGVALLIGAVRDRPIWLWGGRALCWLALGHGALALLVANPLITGEPVGALPLLNLLLLAYAAPAALCALLWYSAARRADPLLAQVAGVAAVVLGFAYVSLGIRHLFHGTDLRAGAVGDAELYCYSAAWLVVAGALIAAGIRAATPALRHAGLALTLLTVIKVFVIDLSGLEGLLRAVSFLGLGVVLVGIGYLYRRYVALLNLSTSR